MRVRYKLTSAFVKSAPLGKHSDGGGLYLYVRNNRNPSWILRFTLHGRRHEMGLGEAAKVTLKAARAEAERWNAVVAAGGDPIRERERLKHEAQRNMHILSDVARDAFESRKAELKGDGSAGRWFSPLELHVLPKLGRTPVAQIDQRDIRDTLTPIWHDKAETARKAMNRLRIVMRHAAALGLEVDLQACDKARALLGTQRHMASHIPAMRWAEVPAFYASLNTPTVTHLALRLLILTGVRSGSLRTARLDQFKGDTWTIPADSMKGRKGTTTNFRVPLSMEAQNVVHEAARNARDGNLFPSVRKGIISDMTLSQHMKRAGLEARPHGFRSSLRDWLAETTNARHEVAETILGHTVGSSVERAYRRTDFLEPRRELLERWAQYVTGSPAQIVKISA
ncbi:integrase arm-type DNA-binding domain-containing protein [Rhodobacteraceae bacterium D3-12]|nr:integrase arm-type DNA-binding domain-containing protein [Rhodobacteraceae bacterium D3-12]